jgi:hypothetical protein
MSWSNGFTSSAATVSAFGTELGAVGSDPNIVTGATIEQLAATNDDYPLTAIKAATQTKLYLPLIQAAQQ